MDQEQFPAGTFLALKDDEYSGGVFHPAQKSVDLDAQGNTTSKTPTAANLNPVVSQPLPKPANIFSKPLPSPSTIAMIGSKKSVGNIATSASTSNGESRDEAVFLPMSLIIKALPAEILSLSPDDAISAHEVAHSTVAVPIREILSQLRTGKIEFPLLRFLEVIPKPLLRTGPPPETKIKLPLSEVVNKIPSSMLGGLSTNLQNASPISGHLSDAPQSQQLKCDSLSVFGNIAAKASPTGGSGTVAAHLPEAPPPGLGISKPKPPLGAIQDKILPPQNAAKPQPIQTLSAHSDPNPFSQRQPDKHQVLAEPASAQSRQSFSPIMGTTNSPATQSQPNALFPKIAPPPPEALASRADNATLPSISLAPTSKTKPPAIGGASRIGQTSATSSRENLAALAKLAAQAGQNVSSEQFKESGPASPDALFKSIKQEKTHPTGSLSHELSQPQASRDLSELAASNEETVREDTGQNSTLIPEFPGQSQVHPAKINFQAEKTMPSGSMADYATEQSAPPRHTKVPAPAQFGIQNFEAETAPAIQDYPVTEQTQYQDAHPKPTIPFKTGLIKPITKPTLFRSADKSPPTAGAKLPANAFRLRPLENVAKSPSLSVNKATTISTPRADPTHRPKDDPEAFDVFPPPASAVSRSTQEPSEQPAPLARKAHTPFSSNTPSAPIRASASVLRTGPARGSLHLTFALARWLGLESDSPVPIESVPVLLTNSPYIKGAAVVDAEGLTLAAHLPHGLSENAIGALTQRLYQQAKTAATEMGSPFEGQCVVSLGRWTLQITHAAPFYLATFHDGLDFPPALARRLRKVAAALVRQETAN